MSGGGMIERVARAIYYETMQNKGYRAMQDKAWGSLAPNHKRYWEKRAIAAIRAMREPDGDMLMAADRALVPVLDAVACWTSMVDAALAPETGRRPA